MTQDNNFRQLTLRAQHQALGARFGAFAGWEMPLWYSGAVEEHMAVRERCGVFDISHMGRLRLDGADAASVLGSLFSRDPNRLENGASSYSFACNDEGGIVDDLITYRLGEENFLVICNASNADSVRSLIESAIEGRAAVLRDLREDANVLLAVQGPEAVATIQSLIPSSVEIGRRRCAEVYDGGREFFLTRTGYTGEDGFEIIAGVRDADWLLQTLTAGGCLPCGLASRDTLRLESALPLHGHDIDETTTPWEAGLGWAVELDHDFRGRDVLEARKDTTERKLACLIADGPGIVRAENPVFAGETQIGTLNSGGYSPVLSKSIAMAYLPLALAREGSELEVEVRGRRIACHVVKRPFVGRSR